MSSAIVLEDVWKVYGKPPNETVALRGVTLEVGRGEFFAVVGPSGSGKTTLLHLVGGLDRATRGRIVVDGVEISSLRRDAELSAYRNRTVGFVFQLFYLVPRLRVLENVELPLVKRGVPREERRRMALEALRLVGVEHLAHKYPTQLSGGEQQRVAIARAIVGKPRVLLADEPTGNLDASSSEVVMETFRRLNRELGVTIVMVTHNLELIWNCHRAAKLHAGRLAGVYTPDRYEELIASFARRG
ncbi:ABC transporter ATP-binding protein [Thermofilum pendens]|uniref:ABC transporter related n=1 Tax=Thermofilum pendens (strain DSM 2475 / Hrk 5) TaxID=368408 RepID=A1S021_THEPD|nr:ABC transporter ATP-binding protein [Thermofilum pendens]ABL78801.1 ABC transporter related [Thermofilum pendens Hrk 5]